MSQNTHIDGLIVCACGRRRLPPAGLVRGVRWALRVRTAEPGVRVVLRHEVVPRRVLKHPLPADRPARSIIAGLRRATIIGSRFCRFCCCLFPVDALGAVDVVLGVDD